jgi:dUTPase
MTPQHPANLSVVALPFVRLHPQRDQDLPLPSYHSEGAAGMDVHVAINDSLTLQPGQITVLPTGLAVAVPAGCELQVRPRSGLAMKHDGIVKTIQPQHYEFVAFSCCTSVASMLYFYVKSTN